MVIKPIFQKDLKPVFEEHGYELCVCERGLYIFESSTDRIDVKFEIDFTFERLDSLMKKRKSSGDTGRDSLPIPYYISVDYSIKKPQQAWRYHVFLGGDFEQPTFSYDNREALKEWLKSVADRFFTDIRFYLLDFAKRYVEPTDEMILELSRKTRQKAEIYARKHNLRMSYDDLQRFEDSLNALRGEDESRWKERFEQNQDEIVLAAAYLGETIIQHYGSAGHGRWLWVKSPEIRTAIHTFPEQSHYEIICYKRFFCPLQMVSEYWNYYPRIKRKNICLSLPSIDPYVIH